MSKPIIFLAFANDRDAYLSMINRERKNVYRTLRRHSDEGIIQLEAEASTTLEDIFDFFTRYDNQAVIFHYGGHASGSHLQLETASAGNHAAGAGGLAQLLGMQENLQLVFLNGCATKPQVELLLKSGVKAVLATSVPIQDKMAVEFAEQFYHALSRHISIKKAFDIATAFVTSKYEGRRGPQTYRGIVLPGSDTGGLPWGLYLNEDATGVQEWTLPKRRSTPNVLRNRFDYETRLDVNDILIDIICEELAEYNADLDDELNKEELDIPSIKREIVDSFPTPIGEHLRKLFTRSNDPSLPDEMEQFTAGRLKQLITTYRTSMQFICYIQLSQLWDEKYKNRELQIGEDYIVDFNSFFTLSEANYQNFDYVKLILTISDIFDDYQIPYFIDELVDLKIDTEREPELYEAYIFMNSVQELVLNREVEKDQTEDLCMEAEHHLGIILKKIAFLVKYKLVTIKNIEIVKSRHEAPRFRHNQITLNRALTVASTGIAEIGVEFDSFTDNKSVLFLKTEDNQIKEFLNLTPFVIDENALNSDYASKLFLFAFQDERAYSYQFLNNLNDEPLIVNDSTYATIQSQFDRFKAEIFDRQYDPRPKSETIKPRGSRFSRKR
ncbi:CHAT domain-containing protein [Flavilitoribacter nigricans]|uniref:CHAT domain-containing protein n=1 Tax=Flavilitoribacter nigricans (strain ATCC 23147 / DSM 23189 / NBRC 102662 / NCIMB 1420 / SS-2) TaxID=1122177 RepID=A0A2D0MXP2_FLAN2|nr:CHAT domain-containing protein [Flavilitoribacter nigricans]PHN00896.1 hypothetical protein CRP01_39850 [Flavilitoribacter nigricans DSM 23189 = NBRC 102662]